jgi:glutathione S-transferase
MIKLYTFGPLRNLPDGSPFVVKAMLLLKFAGLPYQERPGGPHKAPKGKLPFIEDDGDVIADSSFIRFHIENKYGFDFDAGLDARDRAIAWTVEKMCDEHLYWAEVHTMWMDDGNFERGMAGYFDIAPAPLRPLIKSFMRRRVGKTLRTQGFGRHSREELEKLAIRDVESIAAILGDKPFLMGGQPCAADAIVWAQLAVFTAPFVQSPISSATRKYGRLVDYVARIGQTYFPNFPT